MEKTTKGPDRTDDVTGGGAACPQEAGRVVNLPGGHVYHHDLQQLDPGEEGANLLDLKERQHWVPLFSTRTKSVIGKF